MTLRKINAGVSLLTTALFLFHAISIAFWMLSRGEIERPNGLISWVLVGCMAFHAFFSIDLAISAHTDGGKHIGKKYPRLNRDTIAQRVCGVLLIPFTALHVAGATGAMTPPPVVHAVVPVLFFALATAHTAISTGRAFITLGIGDVKAFKVVNVAVKVICAATLIADVVGFYLFVC